MTTYDQVGAFLEQNGFKALNRDEVHGTASSDLLRKGMIYDKEVAGKFSVWVVPDDEGFVFCFLIHRPGTVMQKSSYKTSYADLAAKVLDLEEKAKTNPFYLDVNGEWKRDM